MIQAVQMEFRRQLQCVPWEIKPQKYCSEPDRERERESQPEKQERVSEKQVNVIVEQGKRTKG